MIQRATVFAALALVGLVAGCKDEEKKTDTTAASASAATAAPSASAASSAAATPSASASAEPVEPPHDCPEKSTGPGSFTKPCEAKGSERMMDVKWTKTTNDGPNFSITNKSQKLVILYGRIGVYYYDKAGKQLEIKEEQGKTRAFHTCSGNFFGGPMNPKEKATLTFSCVPKKIVPDGTVTVEAEMQMVGFADAATGKKVDFYWRNQDLTPDARPKGGVK